MTHIQKRTEILASAVVVDPSAFSGELPGTTEDLQTAIGLFDTSSIGGSSSATFTYAAGASNVCVISVVVKDREGDACAAPTLFLMMLSDAATGIGITGTTASGNVEAGTNGKVIGTFTAKKLLLCQTDATGNFDLSITDAGKTRFYPVVFGLGSGTMTVGTRLATADYGA